MSRDSMIGHFHIDPKVIQQNDCMSTLSVGQFVYLDTDGLYKPAIATSLKESGVQGIVWAFENVNTFRLKTTAGPLKYRFPFPKSYYGVDGNGRPDENNVLCDKIPGSLGDKLFLSETVPGGMQIIEPANYPVVLGYKTQFGMIFRPNVYKNCTGII